MGFPPLLHPPVATLYLPRSAHQTLKDKFAPDRFYMGFFVWRTNAQLFPLFQEHFSFHTEKYRKTQLKKIRKSMLLLPFYVWNN